MIKIEITDPHLAPRQLLIDVATLLMKIAGAEVRPAPVPLTAAKRDNIDDYLAGIVPRNELMAAPVGIGTSPANSEKPVSTDGCNELMPAPVEPLRDLTPPPAPGLPDAAFNPFTVDPDLVPRPIKTGVDLDTAGLPWDARIHARTKSKNADGTWKVQRGIDLRKVDEISQQLRASTDTPAPVKGGEFAGFKSDAPELDWPSLMKKITGLVQQGKITQETVVRAVESVGMPSLAVLPCRPDLFAGVSEFIDTYMAGTSV